MDLIAGRLMMNPRNMNSDPLRYGKFTLMSNAKPAQMGPMMRPRLMNELVMPITMP